MRYRHVFELILTFLPGINQDKRGGESIKASPIASVGETAGAVEVTAGAGIDHQRSAAPALMQAQNAQAGTHRRD